MGGKLSFSISCYTPRSIIIYIDNKLKIEKAIASLSKMQDETCTVHQWLGKECIVMAKWETDEEMEGSQKRGTMSVSGESRSQTNTIHTPNTG